MAVVSKPRSLGNLISGGRSNLCDYEEETLEESYYEEEIIDDDEEYIEEEIIYDPKAGVYDLKATQEQVDGMSLLNAKKYLTALPDAKSQTSAPTSFVDDDYEYEEVEISGEITPIRRSCRFSLFEAPRLDTLEEGSERSERSTASSVKHSPHSSKRKDPNISLSNIDEDEYQDEDQSRRSAPPSPIAEQAEGEGSQEIKTDGKSIETSAQQQQQQQQVPKTIQTKTEVYIPEGTILSGGLNDTSQNSVRHVEKGSDPSALSPSKSPSLGRSINKSTKSMGSEGTATTAYESESNNSLDIRQVFGLPDTPPASPRASPELGANRKRRSGGKRNSGSDSSRRGSDNSLDKKLNVLGDTDDSKRRSSGKRQDDDDDDNRSTRSGKSPRGRRSSSGQPSNGKSPRSEKDRVHHVEAEIKELLTLSGHDKSNDQFSLGNMLSTQPTEKVDSDVHSTKSSRSGSSRRRSTKLTPTSEKSRDNGSTAEISKSRENRSRAPTLDPPAKKATTLDDLLARMPSEPTKLGDARSTVSAVRGRSSRSRVQDDDRDCRSVVGTDSSRGTRARSARRSKKRGGGGGGRGGDRDRDDVSVASISGDGRRRARSSSVGRKERLRRNRRKEETEKANRRHQDEKALSSLGRSSQRSTESRPSSGRSNDSRPSSGRNGDTQPSSSRSAGSREGHRKSRRSSTHHDDDSSVGSSRHSLKREGSKGRIRAREEGKQHRSSSDDDDNKSVGSKHHSPSGQGSKGRLKARAEERPRSTKGRMPSNESKGRLEPSSSNGSNGDVDGPRSASNREHSKDGLMDDIDGHASFSRTMDFAKSLDNDCGSDSDDENLEGHASFVRTIELARSMHNNSDNNGEPKGSPRRLQSFDDAGLDENGEGKPEEAPRTPTHRKSERRSSMGRKPCSSHGSKREDPVRTNPTKSHSADDVLLYDPESPDKPRSRKSASAAIKEAVPKTPKDKRRESLKKKHSSDDVLLVADNEASSKDLDAPKTPGGSRRRPPSRSQSTHTSGLSGKSPRETGSRVSYHSPRKPSKANHPSIPATPPSPDRALPGRSRSERSPKISSPVKGAQIRQQRRSSTDMVSPKTPMSPPLVAGGGSSTPFERLSELEMIRTFLSEEEYEDKKKEILSSI